jgi:hypothetical protein
VFANTSNIIKSEAQTAIFIVNMRLFMIKYNLSEGKFMNNSELKKRVHSAMYTLIKKNGIASPVDVLIEIGVLSKEDCERWRFGKVDYLERVCKINLSKLSTINHEIRVFARKNDLKPSWTYYKRWGVKGKNIKLRFSKSNGDQIEKLYATHYVSQRKVTESKERRSNITAESSCEDAAQTPLE